MFLSGFKPLAGHNGPFSKQRFNFLDSPACGKDIVQMNRSFALRFENNVSRTEPQNHMPEEVTALSSGAHARRIENIFPFPNEMMHTNSSRRNHGVNLLVEKEENKAPEDEKNKGSKQVASHI